MVNNSHINYIPYKLMFFVMFWNMLFIFTGSWNIIFIDTTIDICTHTQACLSICILTPQYKDISMPRHQNGKHFDWENCFCIASLTQLTALWKTKIKRMRQWKTTSHFFSPSWYISYLFFLVTCECFTMPYFVSCFN